MTQELWSVTGYHEYEWIVAVYTTEEQAKIHLERLKETIKRWRHLKILRKLDSRLAEARKLIESLDPNFFREDSGRYYIFRSYLYLHFDQYLEEQGQ